MTNLNIASMTAQERQDLMIALATSPITPEFIAPSKEAVPKSSYESPQQSIPQSSYADFMGDSTGYKTQAPVRKASPGALKYYTDLCAQKNVMPLDGHLDFDASRMSKEIEAVKKLGGGGTMSPKQRAKIEEVIVRSSAFIDMSVIAPDWKTFDIPKASELIGKLFEIERENKHLRPISDAQVDKIVRMYLCPDVIFTELGWVEKYEMLDGHKMLLIPNSSDVKVWLSANLNSEGASEFIRKFNVPYMNWARQRVSPEQQKMIRTLESRCANIHGAGASHEATVDADGNKIEVNVASRKEWAPIAYNSLTDLQMYMMSKDDASRYIEELQRTLADKDAVKFIQEPMNGDYLEAQRVGEGETAVDNDLQAMSNFIHAIFASTGEELFEEDLQMCNTKTTSLTYDVIKYIRDLFAHAISCGTSLATLDNFLDMVPNVRAELYAK